MRCPGVTGIDDDRVPSPENPPEIRGFSERLMGFEPTTFCMASGRFGTGSKATKHLL
jgi:hypothetical protein